jgi:uncharacterized protein (DUF2236 family)
MTERIAEREQLEGFFGPESIAWRINRETVTLLAGGRALLLQLAHPLVAAGVAAHSSFREAPGRRLQRTVTLTQTIIFGTRPLALRAAAEVQAVHVRVRGTLETDLGPFPAGTAYRASDPDLAGWVLATLVDSALVGYELLVGRLPPDAEARFWREAILFAELLRIPASRLPAEFAHFRPWFQERLRTDVAVTPLARELARPILHLERPLVARLGSPVLRGFTVGLLPPKIREGYRLRWEARDEAAFRSVAFAVRRLRPLLPRRLRLTPSARDAERRLLPAAGDQLP